MFNEAKKYEYEVNYLRDQVEQLDQINRSLERKCYANTVAKPEL